MATGGHSADSVRTGWTSTFSFRMSHSHYDPGQKVQRQYPLLTRPPRSLSSDGSESHLRFSLLSTADTLRPPSSFRPDQVPAATCADFANFSLEGYLHRKRQHPLLVSLALLFALSRSIFTLSFLRPHSRSLDYPGQEFRGQHPLLTPPRRFLGSNGNDSNLRFGLPSAVDTL